MRSIERDEGLRSYLSTGKSLRKIADELGVAHSTVLRWSAKDGWAEKKRLAWLDIVQSSTKQRAIGGYTHCEELSTNLFKLAKNIHNEISAFWEGKIPKRQMRSSIRDLCRVASAFSAVQASTFPMPPRVQKRRKGPTIEDAEELIASE